MNKKITFSIPISKVDEEQRIVYGVATAEVLDKQGEIVDYEASKKAFSEWAGNIREMHRSDSAVGKAVDIQFDDENKAVVIGAYISKSPDGENAWTKVKENILTGFSIGGRVFETVSETAKSADGKEVSARRIKSYELAETSLVDVPACPVAEFVMVKSADGKKDELEVTEKMVEHPKPVPVLGWQKTFIYSIDQFQSMQKAQAEETEVKEFAKVDVPELEKKDYSDKERADMADSGEALPDGSFPIKNKQDLKNAIKAVGRAKDEDKAKAHIKKRAKALGAEDLIPDTWKAVEAEDLQKAEEVETPAEPEKGVEDEESEKPEASEATEPEEAVPAAQPETPVAPADPAEPVAPEEPAAPEAPAEPVAPAPEAPAEPGPAVVEAADKPTDLRKDLYSVGSLADAIACITCIRDWAVMEADWEGDGSTVPAQLTQAIEDLGGILTTMAAEESQEAAHPEATEEVVLLGDKTADLSKLQAQLEQSTNDAIERQAELLIGKVAEVIKPLADRLSVLENQPATASRPAPTFVEVDKSVAAPTAPSANAGEHAELTARWTELRKISMDRKNDPSFTLPERQRLVDEMWKINKKLNGTTTADLDPSLPATFPAAFRTLQ